MQSEVGTVQGGSISPLLANIYLHYVFDLWVQRWRRTQAHGDVIVVRFADDFVVGFERQEAETAPERAARAVGEVRAGAAPGEDPPDRVRPLCGARPAQAERRKAGDVQLPRLHAHLREDAEGKVHGAAADDAQAVAGEAEGGQRRASAAHARPHPRAGTYLRSVVAGHIRYYGVPMNGGSVSVFRPAWAGSGTARSGAAVRRNASWKRMKRYVTRWLPPARICHPYPCGALASSPKAGAGCGNAARPDLWRGLWVTMIPTPTLGTQVLGFP